MGRVFWLLGGLAVFGVGAFLLHSWLNARDQIMSQAPVREAGVASVPEAPSNLQASLAVPISLVAAKIEEAMPTSHVVRGRQNVCADVRRVFGSGEVGRLFGNIIAEVTRTERICQDVDYNVTISRSGPVQFTPSGDRIEFRVPISASGQAGFTGEIAEALDLDAKNFRGALEATITASIDLTDDWCPVLVATGSFTWTERARVEVMGDWWVSIDGQVSGKLQSAIEDGIAKAKEKLTCALVRDRIVPFWITYALPITLPDVPGDLAHLHARPVGLGFSGISYGREAITLALRADLVTEIRSGPPPASESAGPLPKLRRIAADPGRIKVHLPVRAAYDRALAELNRQFGGKVYKNDTPAGSVTVTVRELTLYPAGDRLAAGVSFVAEVRGRLFDTSGWVYLTGRPEIVDGTTLRIADIEVTRQLDNHAWSSLSSIFEEEIVKRLEAEAVVDLKPQIALIHDEIDAALASLAADRGVCVTLDDRVVEVAALVPAESAIEAVAEFSGTARVVALSLEGAPATPPDSWRAGRERLAAPTATVPGFTPVLRREVNMEMVAGRNIELPGGEPFGKITALVTPDCSAPRHLVVDLGGFVGFGATIVGIGLDEVNVLRDDAAREVRVVADVTKDELARFQVYGQ